MKNKGRIQITFAEMQELFGLTKKATTINKCVANKDNETIQLEEIVRKGKKDHQSSTRISYELIARQLNLPLEIRIDSIDVKEHLMANELPGLLITISSEQPVKNYTKLIAEGANIPMIKI